jgi:hypothetical protein
MQRGIALEPLAREALAFELGEEITQCGFIGNEVYGSSPDGLTKDATCELKCPEAIAFVAFAIGAEIDPKYYAQVHLQMMVLGCMRGHLAYYHPEFPRPLVARCVWRDEEYCAKLQAEIEKAEIEICEIVRRLS